jgi:hypothetical protein
MIDRLLRHKINIITIAIVSIDIDVYKIFFVTSLGVES